MTAAKKCPAGRALQPSWPGAQRSSRGALCQYAGAIAPCARLAGQEIASSEVELPASPATASLTRRLSKDIADRKAEGPDRAAIRSSASTDDWRGPSLLRAVEHAPHMRQLGAHSSVPKSQNGALFGVHGSVRAKGTWRADIVGATLFSRSTAVDTPASQVPRPGAGNFKGFSLLTLALTWLPALAPLHWNGEDGVRSDQSHGG